MQALVKKKIMILMPLKMLFLILRDNCLVILVSILKILFLVLKTYDLMKILMIRYNQESPKMIPDDILLSFPTLPFIIPDMIRYATDIAFHCFKYDSRCCLHYLSLLLFSPCLPTLQYRFVYCCN